jgi:hypothetical protein
VALPHDREGFSFDEGFSSNERKILRDHRLPWRQLDISRITGASYGRISGLPFVPSAAATSWRARIHTRSPASKSGAAGIATADRAFLLVAIDQAGPASQRAAADAGRSAEDDPSWGSGHP